MKTTKTLLSIIAFALLLFSCSSDDDGNSGDAELIAYYVSSTNGDDNRTPLEAQNSETPWKTIQKAANNIPGGATVIISGGIYNEKVTIPPSCNGTENNPTTFKSKDGEIAILDGNNTGSMFEALFKLKDNNYINVTGLKAQNGYWYGFSGENTNYIQFKECQTFNTRASGIYVKTSTNLTIINNDIQKACQWPGRIDGVAAQECISVVACDIFKVSDNEVYNSTIDGEGGEGIDAKAGSTNGEISNNYVHDLYEIGLYVDAGSRDSNNVRVFNNKVFNCGGGIYVACELGGTLNKTFIYNNIFKENRTGGIVFQSTGNGTFTNIYFVNNTCYNNAHSDFAGDVANYNDNPNNSNLVIKNNIFYNKTSNYRFSVFLNDKNPHVISHNLYFDFKPGNNGPNSFTTNDLTTNDILENPLFENASNSNFILKNNSPAINKGVAITLPSSSTLMFTTDYNGKARGSNNWDFGAYEY